MHFKGRLFFFFKCLVLFESKKITILKHILTQMTNGKDFLIDGISHYVGQPYYRNINRSVVCKD